MFRGDPSKPRNIARSNNALCRVLLAVGTTGDRLALARDALLGIGRIAPFVLGLRKDWIIPEFEARLNAVTKDIASLNDYESHLSKRRNSCSMRFWVSSTSSRAIFLEDGSRLTIVSVVGIRPTLVAGIYGMNFKYMPELNWVACYPYGLALIALSAIFHWPGSNGATGSDCIAQSAAGVAVDLDC